MQYRTEKSWQNLKDYEFVKMFRVRQRSNLNFIFVPSFLKSVIFVTSVDICDTKYCNNYNN